MTPPIGHLPPGGKVDVSKHKRADRDRRDSLKATDCEALLQRIRVKGDALATSLVMSTGP